jgi:hypothetical protein|tara:strand:- start:3593 stop:3976 length:384 start_codon:yes stop_codon:yes gene_type:complete
MKNIKQANINITLKNLFLKWLDITSFFHNLTSQQKKVLALFLYYHYKYKQEITNEKILWKLVFDYETKLLIEQELNLKNAGLRNILTVLRKRNIINERNEITPAYIPELGTGSKEFKVIFNFNIIHE